jgi:CRP-like cAMP-binding protein
MDHSNRLLRALSDTDREILHPLLIRAELPRGCELVAPHRPIADAWFLESGLSSIIAMSGKEQGVEVGLAGRDGLVGMPLLLDADRTPHRVFMQVEGVGYRIAARDLTAVLDEHAAIRKTLLRYVQAYATQTTYTALSNAVDTVEARMARWLLMSHDRQDSDEISLTHEFLALMLGIQRPTVTLALHSLEGMGLIKATRGLVTVRNRQGLEAFAGNAYGVPEAEYERLIGPLR